MSRQFSLVTGWSCTRLICERPAAARTESESGDREARTVFAKTKVRTDRRVRRAGWPEETARVDGDGPRSGRARLRGAGRGPSFSCLDARRVHLHTRYYLPGITRITGEKYTAHYYTKQKYRLRIIYG